MKGVTKFNNKMSKKINKAAEGGWYYFWGHLLSVIYDKKYIRGKWFKGKYHGMCALGWKWVTIDALHRLIFNVNRGARFPISFRSTIIFPENVHFHSDDLNNFQSTGIYIQAMADVVIGRGTYIAPNVGIITSNHSIGNLDMHEKPKPVRIGSNCWIGMNSVILPGVILGKHTIVGAGSIVTKSFIEGNCVIAGNPAKIIRRIDRNIVVDNCTENEWYKAKNKG